MLGIMLDNSVHISPDGLKYILLKYANSIRIYCVTFTECTII